MILTNGWDKDIFKAEKYDISTDWNIVIYEQVCNILSKYYL